MEIKNLMNLLMEYLKSELEELKTNNIKLRILGDISALGRMCRRNWKKRWNKPGKTTA